MPKATRKPKTNRVPRTRAGGEWTEASFWNFLRSGFRRMSLRWPPLVRLALDKVRRPFAGGGRQKWEYQCESCGKWFPRKEVEVDHIEPCGSLKCSDDLKSFVERLFCETDKLRVLCNECHAIRTAGVPCDTVSLEESES